MNKGVASAIGAYILWGILPVYWKAIKSVPAIEISSHRIIWSFLFVILVVFITGEWPKFKEAVRDRKTLEGFILTAFLLGVNWLTYVWGVNAGYIVETSLGYFINPLVNVLLGVIFLGERLRPWQWFSVLMASLGIVDLTWLYGSFPWISMILAMSFAFYGFTKKKTALNSIQGVMVETGILFVPAFVYVSMLETSGQGAFGNEMIWVVILLVFSGVTTSLPLLLFSAAVKRIELSTIGFLQYIAPTFQFLIGVFIYGEAFPIEKLVGFGLIWIALLIFSLDGLSMRRKQVSLSRN